VPYETTNQRPQLTHARTTDARYTQSTSGPHPFGTTIGLRRSYSGGTTASDNAALTRQPTIPATRSTTREAPDWGHIIAEMFERRATVSPDNLGYYKIALRLKMNQASDHGNAEAADLPSVRVASNWYTEQYSATDRASWLQLPVQGASDSQTSFDVILSYVRARLAYRYPGSFASGHTPSDNRIALVLTQLIDGYVFRYLRGYE
jgi:hypothetical protein